MAPKKYSNDKVSDYGKAAWEGAKAGYNDLEHIVLHPIDTVTHTVETVGSLLGDTFVYTVGTRVFDQQTYDEATRNFVKRNENIQRIFNDIKDATGPDVVEVIARGFVGGLGTRAMHKTFLKVAGLKNVPDAPPATYHDKVRAYAKEYGQKDRPKGGPLLESIEMYERYPAAKANHHITHKAKEMQHNFFETAATFGVVYGASDQNPTHSSFINEARADEYEEEIFFDAPEYEASSGPQFESKKPEYKKPASRNKQETTREEFTKNYGIHEENLYYKS